MRPKISFDILKGVIHPEQALHDLIDRIQKLKLEIVAFPVSALGDEDRVRSLITRAFSASFEIKDFTQPAVKQQINARDLSALLRRQSKLLKLISLFQIDARRFRSRDAA